MLPFLPLRPSRNKTMFSFDLRAAVRKKPSVAIRAAIAGLNKRKDDPKFVFDMDTYGRREVSGTCFGCMATVSVESITNTDLTVKTITGTNNRADSCGVAYEALDDFEFSMNAVRCNDLYSLYHFCGVTREEQESLPTSVIDNGNRYLLDGTPSTREINYAISALDIVAKQLEAKGF